ncbi:MAG: RHO alpha subunit C-terminal catalytic domain-containing protein [Acidiferrobacterales bacterium]
MARSVPFTTCAGIGRFPWCRVKFDVFPEKTDFFQMLPLGPGKTRIRGRTYALPGDRRAMRAGRYLSDRANRRIQDEDAELVEEVQEGLASGSYTLAQLSGFATLQTPSC